MSGYDLTQLLPALEQMWRKDRAKAEAAFLHCISDCKAKHLELTRCCLETALEQLKAGRDVSVLGAIAVYMESTSEPEATTNVAKVSHAKKRGLARLFSR